MAIHNDGAFSTHWFARRPAVPATLLLIAGIILHRFSPSDPGVYLLLATLLLILALLSIKSTATSTACLAGALTLCGITLGQLAAFYYPAHDIAHFTSREPQLAQMTIQIDQTPQLIQPAENRQYASPPRRSFTATVLSVRTASGWLPASGVVAVQLSGDRPGLAEGQRCRVIGELGQFRPASNPGGFDSRDYHRHDRQLATLSISRPSHLVVLSQANPSLLQRLRSKAQMALDAGFAPSRAQDRVLLDALLLGQRAPGLRDIQDDFRRTGTGHHLSTSGMHVAVVALLIYLLCRLLLLSPRRSALLALFFTVLYGLVTVPSPPITRSLILAGAFAAGVLLRRPGEGGQLLALSALVMLALEPLDLYSPGFQLTFLAVLALMLYTRPLTHWMQRGRMEDRQAARAALPGTRPPLRQRVAAAAHAKVIMIAATGLAAWFITAPLIAFHFEHFNPWTLFAGALLEPLVFASIIAAAIKMILTLLFPPLAPTAAWIAAWPADGLREGVAALARLPWTDLPIAPPPAWLMIVWYSSMLLALVALVARLQAASIEPDSDKTAPPAADRNCRTSRAVLTLCAIAPFVALSLGFVHLAFSSPSIKPHSLRLTVLSVGAGQCAVLELPGQRTYLFDAGSTTISSLHRTCLEPFLRSRGITRIDALFISHTDLDHFSAAADAITAYDIPAIYFSDHFVEETRHNASAHQLMKLISSRHLTPTHLTAGGRVYLNDDTLIQVLWPPPDGSLHDNNASLVLKLTLAGKSILLTGDIQAAAEQALLENPQLLASDLLLAPHHGSAESTTDEFIRAVHPSAIVSSNDQTPTKKQRDFARKLNGIPLYKTDECGAVTITIDGGGMRIDPFLKDRAP